MCAMKTGSGQTRDPKMPFSNSDEGCSWTANWCDRCIHDKPARQDRYEDACAILTLRDQAGGRMRWGRLPASHLQVVAEALGEKSLYFVSLGRLTIIWEAP